MSNILSWSMNISWWIHTSNKPLLCKSMEWFLYNRDLSHERVKTFFIHHIWKFAFTYRKAELDSFFLSGFSFTNIHYSKDNSGEGKTVSLYPFYHIYLFHRHLDIYQIIATGRSSLRKAGSRQADSNREHSVSWLKSRTTELRALENPLFLHLHC